MEQACARERALKESQRASTQENDKLQAHEARDIAPEVANGLCDRAGEDQEAHPES